MKNLLSIILVAIIALAGAYVLGRSHAPEPEKIEVVKIVEKEVVKTVFATEKTAKAKTTNIKQTAKDGTVTETVVSETELQDKALESFIAEKLKKAELVKEIYNEWKSLYGASAGINKNSKIIADFEYGYQFAKVFDRPVYVKAELNFESDTQLKDMSAAGAKVGLVLLN